MPGTLHQGLLAIFEEDPWLGFDLLGFARPVEGMPIDRRAEIQRPGETPWIARPGYPDLVMVHRATPKSRRGAVISIEAQKKHDAIKRWMIPVYQSHLAEKHRLETWSVVVSLCRRFSRALRRWARGGPPRVDALVIDVESVPISPWLDEPARRPMAAVLVGTLHGHAGNFDAARRAFRLVRTMPEKRRHQHGMTILAALPETQRKQLIQELPMPEQHEWMDVERRSGTYQFGRQEGRQEGRKEGRKEGRQEGRQEGLEEGRKEGLEEGLEEGRAVLLELIFDLLAERGVTVSRRAKTRIQSCEDLATLQRWARRAVHASSAKDLFASE